MALRDRALAKDFEGQEWSAWVEVEVRTADLLMAFLASILGNDEQVAMDPITNSETALAAFTTLPEPSRPIGTELDPIRYALLRDILPGPAAGIEPELLAAFKHDHRDLLIRFRGRVEDKVTECAREDDPRLRDRVVESARRELADELREIESRMGERRWPLAARGALGVVVAAAGLSDLVITGGSLLAITSGGLGLAGAVDAAFQGRKREDLLERPLALAALARRDLAAAAAV
jgi:hypothetical protein